MTRQGGHDSRTPVAVLGATGAVGQRFVALLDGHPWFRVTALAASDRSAGKPYAEAVRWFLPDPMPEWAGGMTVVPCDPRRAGARVAFSGLDAAVAGEIETAFAAAGAAVVSNARNHRMTPDVPLLIPEINADHLDLIEAQRRRLGGGYIVTNPNCSTVGLAVSLAPLHRGLGVRRAIVATLQAVSGAGYPGVPSLDIQDNIIPYIGGEEEKMESETRKILGAAGAPAAFSISAHCHRVQVSDGHTLAVSVETERKAGPEEAAALLGAFRPPVQALGLPSLPERLIEVRPEIDRPQPRLDRLAGRGMTVSVGRVRRCPVLDLKYVALVHNTIRGAAGVAILNAELLRARGLL